MHAKETYFAQAVAGWREGKDLDESTTQLLAHMTVDEKLAMLDGDTEFWEGRIRALSLGQSNRTCPAAGLARLGIPGFEFLDGPRGVGLGQATCFPVSMARGATFDPNLEEAIGEAIGLELKAKGGTLFGGVCVNLLRHPAWGRAQETYGEDPYLVGEMGAGLTTGVQRHVMACVKHFALNSMESSRHRVDVTCEERPLHEVYLPHFRRVVEAGVAVVMSAYNSVNGNWCGHSRHLLTEILREEWSFDGVVITDFIFGIRDAEKSVKAGVDIEMPYRMIRWQHLPQAIGDGRVAQHEVDAIVHRILRTLIRFEHLRATPLVDPTVIVNAAHVALALRAARESIVLLENRDLLPLASGSLSRIALIGRLAEVANLGDGGSSAVHPPYVVTPAEGIRRAFPDATVVVSHDDGSAALNADVAIVIVGNTMNDEGEFLDLDAQLPMLDAFAPPFTDETQRQQFQYLVEHQDVALAEPPGGDRATLRLSERDERLILEAASTNTPVVVVLMGGSALVTDGWRDRVSAILHAWYPGMEGGTAIADVLAGVVNPSGHLPFAVPQDEQNLPAFDLLADRATYGLMHGQWWLDDLARPARYPFGHGLSYTRFVPTSLTVESEEDGCIALVGWSNVGSHGGDDVIQIYASFAETAWLRPRRRLVGFARIHLAAAQSTIVRVPLDLRQLAVRQEGLWIWEDARVQFEASRWSGDPESAYWSGFVDPPLLPESGSHSD